MGSDGDVAVVHLVWAPLGLSCLERFLAAYRAHAAGREHQLVMIFNGFAGRGDRRVACAERLLEDIQCRSVHLPAPVPDLLAYRQAAAELDARILCFLNSYSRPLVDGWLAILAEPLSGEIGVVGATGCWASHASHVRFSLGFGGAYERQFADPAVLESALHPQLSSDAPSAVWRSRSIRARERFDAVRVLLTKSVAYRQFPAPHLRTNGFLIARETWLSLCSPRLAGKMAAYRLESGRRSMTARLQARGLRVLVAGRDGRTYDRPEWPASRTFWQGDQENLLIADNQTDLYQRADFDARQALSRYAWGSAAAPTMPAISRCT